MRFVSAFLAFCLSAATVLANADFNLALDLSQGSVGYQLLSNGEVWLQGGDVYLHQNSKKYSASAGTLLLDNNNMTSSTGFDSALGPFKQVSARWSTSDQPEKPVLSTVFKIYEKINAVGFEQLFLEEIDGTSTGNANAVVSSFPSFKIPETCTNGEMIGSKGFLSWSGSFLMEGHVAEFCKDKSDQIPFGLQGGPLVLFEPSATERASIFAPASEFMSFSGYVDQAAGEIQYGVMGNVTSIPAGFSVESLIYFGQEGVNRVVKDWGHLLLKKYGNDRPFRESDPTLKLLGYSTDNGAYYYYLTEKDMNYEDTLIGVKEYADSVNIPFKYALLDSWWYYQGSGGGVTNWVARPDIFPHGLQYFHEKTGWFFQGHNRYWAPENVYAKEYDFIVEQKLALPVSQDFWNDLMRNASEWGLRVYEQDWLYNEFVGVHHTIENAKLARQWLIQMGTGAYENGIAIQYCMPYPRHILQSLEIPAVSQSRASDDYQSTPNNWKIGTSSIIMDAMGLAPSKDSTWSISKQPDAKPGHSEPYPALQTVVLALSKGPVAFSDKIGYSNVDLIMSTTTADGRLLQPSVPAKSIDRTFAYRAFGKGGVNGQVNHAYSKIGELAYHQVMVAQLAEDFDLLASDFHYNIQPSDQYVSYTKLSAGKFGEVKPFYGKLGVTKCGTDDFQVHYFAPVLTGDVVFLGEVDKVVPVSPDRFTNIVTVGDAIHIHARGMDGEVLKLAFAKLSDPSNVDVISVTLPVDVIIYQ